MRAHPAGGHYTFVMSLPDVRLGSPWGSDGTLQQKSEELPEGLAALDKAPLGAPASSAVLASFKAPIGARGRDKILAWIRANGGVAFNEGSRQHVVVRGRSTDLTPGDALLEFILTEALGMSSVHREAKDALLFLRAWILENSPSVVRASFSLAVEDRIYIPTTSGLLQITPDSLAIVPPIDNQDKVWLTHPRDQPFNVRPDFTIADARNGLLALEELIVRQQSVKQPSLAWFVALNGLLAPFLRQKLGARFIALNVGPSQSGKTTGAQLLLDALGLGSVTGHASTAGLHAEETGLLVLDNLETDDWRPELIQFALHAATGAERLRSTKHGKPIYSQNSALLVITSIEGVPRIELRNRTASIEYARPTHYFSRRDATDAVISARPGLHTAIVWTLQAFLRRPPVRHRRKALANFSEHYSTLVTLLSTIGELLGRPPSWADAIASSWDDLIFSSEAEERTSDELEVQLLAATRRLGNAINYRYRDTPGRLFITTATQLASVLGTERGPAAVGRRLRGAEFKEIRVLCAEDVDNVPELRRSSSVRRLGIFVPTTTSSGPPLPPVLRQVDPAQHIHLPGETIGHFVWDYRSPAVDPDILKTIKTEIGSDSHLSDRSAILLEELCTAVQRLAPAYWTDAVFCPIPNSRGRQTHLLTVLSSLGIGHAMPLLCLSEQMIPRSKCIPPDELGSIFFIHAMQELPFEPRHIVIVDDVLSTGAHFAAARQALRKRFPAATITGFFIFRNAASSARPSVLRAIEGPGLANAAMRTSASAAAIRGSSESFGLEVKN